jgi:hypothetical protein
MISINLTLDENQDLVMVAAPGLVLFQTNGMWISVIGADLDLVGVSANFSSNIFGKDTLILS